jgi:hypothetical protein
MNRLTNTRWIIPMLALVATLGLAGTASAEDKKSGTDSAHPSRTTTINFEDDTIEGDLSRPDGEYVEGRKAVKHSNLIRIREEFKQKVMESVGEL